MGSTDREGLRLLLLSDESGVELLLSASHPDVLWKFSSISDLLA